MAHGAKSPKIRGNFSLSDGNPGNARKPRQDHGSEVMGERNDVENDRKWSWVCENLKSQRRNLGNLRTRCVVLTAKPRSRVVHTPCGSATLRLSAYPHFRKCTRHREHAPNVHSPPVFSVQTCKMTDFRRCRSGLPEWCTRHVEVDPLDFRHTPISRKCVWPNRHRILVAPTSTDFGQDRRKPRVTRYSHW